MNKDISVPSKKIESHDIFLFIFSVACGLALWVGFDFLFLICALLILLGMFKSPSMGICLYILSMPIFKDFHSGHLSIFITYMVLLVFGLSSIHKFQTNVTFRMLLFYMSIIFFVVLSSLVSQYLEYAHVGFVLVGTLGISFVVFFVTLNYDNATRDIPVSFILSCIIVTLFSLYNFDSQFSRLTLGGTPLADGGNVRELANILGVGMVMLMIFSYYVSNRTIQATTLLYGYIHKGRYAIFLLFLYALMLSMSRGLMFSFAISFVAMMLVFLLSSEIKASRKVFSFIGILAFIIPAVGLLINVTAFGTETALSDRFFSRFTNDALDDGSSIRLSIWRAGIQDINGLNFWFGNGISSFRSLAIQSGYDYYAHSFFIDMFVSIGFIGTFVFLCYLILIFRKAVVTKKYEVIPLYIFAISIFITHGTFTAPLFWILMAFISGIVFKRS